MSAETATQTSTKTATIYRMVSVRTFEWFIAFSMIIGTIGAASVVNAVYIDKRELKCACVGGSSNVPLGFVSFTENIAMVSMAIWMGVKHLA